MGKNNCGHLIGGITGLVSQENFQSRTKLFPLLSVHVGESVFRLVRRRGGEEGILPDQEVQDLEYEVRTRVDVVAAVAFADDDDIALLVDIVVVEDNCF